MHSGGLWGLPCGGVSPRHRAERRSWLWRLYSDLTVPDNLTQIDTYFYAKEMDTSKAKMLPDLQHREQTPERIRTLRMHSLLQLKVS